MAPDDGSLGTGRTGGREATTGVIPGRFALSVGMPDSVPPKGWKWTPLSSVAQLESGHTPSRRHAEYWDGDIPWVGIRDATENHGRTIDDTLQHVTELGLANSSARLLPANTVCLSRTASVGFVIVMGRPMATSQDFVNWVCGPKLDAHFLKYVLLAENEALWRFASGTTHQTIYYPEAKAFHVCLPPIAEQKAIVGLLGSLDNKIELNRRMDATLEAMARALFQSWFVDFDPVRAKLDGSSPADLDPATAALFPASFQDSTLGPIPTGWRATTLGEVIEILDSRRVPLSGREREIRQGKYPYHGAASVMDHIDGFLFDGVHVLMGEDGSVINSDGTPVLQYVWGKFWVNNHAHVLRGKNEVSTEHLLLHLKNCNIAPFVNGAVQPKLNQGNMNRIAFVSAPQEICNAFARAIGPLFAHIRANSEQSRTLATLRDTLLPKLLSGELSISTAAETNP
jgi:type I restriction enzyme S subunit